MTTGDWAWIGLVVLINAYWISYDVWASKTNHPTMTSQMHRYLLGHISGPIVFGILCFVVGAFMYHMLTHLAGK